MSLRLALALATLLAAPAAPAATRALVGREVHLGDGRVIADGVVVVEDGRVRSVGARSAVAVPAGAEVRELAAITPGLVAALVAPGADDVDGPSADASRLAVERFDPFGDPSRLLDSGITAAVLSPGGARLVAGRGGVLRATSDPTRRVSVREGAVHAVLSPEALSPPLLFEPEVPVNVDSPLEPARPQRPHAPFSAVAELRRLLASEEAPWPDVRRGAVLLRVKAHREADVRRAVALAREWPDARVVLEGATEAWRLAREIAEARMPVVLAVPDPRRPAPPPPSRGEWRPDAAAVLAAAGVTVVLASESDAGGEPLLLAAAAVRAGLPAADAIAAVTSRAAAAAGAPGLGALRPGAPADLVGWSAPPLAASARPELVLVDGEERVALAPAPPETPLAVRAGRAHSGGAWIDDAVLVARAGVVAAVGPSSAVPAGTRIVDFGRDSVLVPGFVDAFSFAGLEPGPPAQGGARARAADAIELDEPSLAQALAAGVTSALVAPPTGGPLRGAACVLSTAPLLPGHEPPPHPLQPAPRPLSAPKLELLATDAGFVFWLDGGPDDDGPRAQRLEGLKALVGRAKSYHEGFEKPDKKEKKDDAPGGKGEGGKPKGDAKKEKKKDEPKEPPKPDPGLDPLRALFQGKAKAYLRAGRHDTIVKGLDVLQEAGLTPSLVGAEQADLVKDELLRRKVSVVLGPGLVREQDGRLVNVAAELRAAGVPVAFGSLGFGGAAYLPLAASAAVKSGLSPDDALAALTTTAADVAGLPGRLGRLARGDRADFVVFSGDPFEPASRVLAVAVRGRLVVRAGEETAP